MSNQKTIDGYELQEGEWLADNPFWGDAKVLKADPMTGMTTPSFRYLAYFERNSGFIGVIAPRSSDDSTSNQ